MGLGQARPSQGRVVQGFPNTLVDKRTGFVAGFYLKNGSEVVIQFAGLGSQHNGIGQFMRCAFQSLGLWVPKNFAQASKVTQMVQEHLRELNKLRPAGQQYTLALRDLAQARLVYLLSKVRLSSLVGDDANASVEQVNGSLAVN